MIAIAAAPVHAAPPPGGGGDPYNPGIRYVEVTSTPGSDSHVVVTAVCPAGTRALGGGGKVLGATNQVFIHRSQPTDSGFVVEASERADLHAGNFPGTWSVQVTAACGPDYPGFVYVNVTSAADSQQTKSAIAECPPRTTKIGMGASIRGGGRAVRFDSLWRAYLSNSGQNPESVKAVASEIPPGTTSVWNVVATVVCAQLPQDVRFAHMLDHVGSLYGSSGSYLDSCEFGGGVHRYYMVAVGGEGQHPDPGELSLQWYLALGDKARAALDVYADDDDHDGDIALMGGFICAYKIIY
ncbi:hypothetical protein GCM10009662_80390 [Catellatospora coxensis]|uniref:Uncharacterized protein n=2 Tax=Catellatospora coxensis TaxID=310354 RepID=A0A8J3PB87_9ACTN|nr:hypothetical protein Cco03nite_73370 [Catellatospora coxensis]